MVTSGEISVLIKFSLKREKHLENLKEKIKNIQQITPNKITKFSTTRWTVRVKSQVIGCQSQIGKFDLVFRFHLGHNLSEKMSATSSKQLAKLIISLL